LCSFLFGDIHRQGVPEDAALTNLIVAGSPSVELQTVRSASRIFKTLLNARVISQFQRMPLSSAMASKMHSG
jgi:hypothetical protein